jgi:8-oxo-dGDP phosphatase
MRQAWVPRARFEEMISEGAITDDSTVAAYALLLLSERTREHQPASLPPDAVNP